MRPADRPEGIHEASTRVLLDGFATGDPDDVLQLGAVFAGLGKRSFGMLLFVSTLPAFIPIPGVGGAISGPLVALIGAQLLVGLPIPFTNFLFGALLLLFSLALLERDGLLMGVAWAMGAIAVGVFGVLSGQLAAMAARWVDLLI